MIKVGILTINDDNNYGNRLQNYAVQTVLRRTGFDVETILNGEKYYNKDMFSFVRNNIKLFLKKTIFRKKYMRYIKFLQFNRNISFSKFKIDRLHISDKINESYDYFLVGSDQVWNPTFRHFSHIDLLSFVDDFKRISFSASFGIEQLPCEYHDMFKRELSKFRKISVREDAGKKIIGDLMINCDVDVLVDPTMLLCADEWNLVSRRPKQLDDIKQKKYILNYFLGSLSDKRRMEIERVAKENDCYIINILDKNDPFYFTGPSEFLYLEKNAFLICTDSFHSSVFAILYNVPFIVFDREDKKLSMNSRIETLLSKFHLKNRKFNGEKITDENLKHDYREAYNILEKERKKSEEFLKEALLVKSK